MKQDRSICEFDCRHILSSVTVRFRHHPLSNFFFHHFILWLSACKNNIYLVILINVYIALKLFVDNWIVKIKPVCCSFTLTGIMIPMLLCVFLMIWAAVGTKDCFVVACILCFMPRNVDPRLLHQMVLEDNIAASLFCISPVRKHFLQVKINLWCVNKTADV